MLFFLLDTHSQQYRWVIEVTKKQKARKWREVEEEGEVEAENTSP